MTTFKNIKGFEIQYLDSDPATSNVGQVWYNSTSKALKGTTAGGAPSATWASGGNLNQARQQITGCGIQTAALAVAGEGPTYSALSESYNGSAWTEGNDLNQARAFATALGLQTAALVVGGYDGGATYGLVESYDGTSYTEVNNLGTPRNASGSSGIQTAGLVFGGGPPAGGLTEKFDGTNWTESGDLNTGRRILAGAGTQTASLAFGGSLDNWNKSICYRRI